MRLRMLVDKKINDEMYGAGELVLFEGTINSWLIHHGYAEYEYPRETLAEFERRLAINKLRAAGVKDKLPRETIENNIKVLFG